MSLDKYYMKPNIVAEPLFNQWYAWAYLISPPSAAMAMANLHLPLMKSFISAPQVHANAARNRALLGGKFIGHPAERVPDLKVLLETTQTEQSYMFKLADAIKQLDNILLNEAKGYSLSDIYQKVPTELKGYVELAYDLNNQPSIRFLESLLYRSHYYDESRQGFNLYAIETDERPFSLSTPRLENERSVILQLPFSSEVTDKFFQMKDKPFTFSEIKENLALEDRHDKLFKSFLTKQPPNKAVRYDGDGVRIRYYGHASVLLETSQVSVLVDPVLSYAYPNGLSRYTYLDLPDRIDYVLLTHNHQDHVLLETLLQIRHRVGHVVVPKNGGGFLQDPSLKLMLENIGFSNVIELGDLDTIDIDGGQIVGLPFLGEHSDLAIQSKLAYFLRLKEKTFLLAADSCNLAPELYTHLHAVLGDVDVLFIGMECDGAQ